MRQCSMLWSCLLSVILSASLIAQTPPRVNVPSPSENSARSPIALAAVMPTALMQCEQDQCTRGGGGAVWIFEGMRGEALWHFGAVADLSVRRFDGHNLVIYRSDPVGTYSSRWGINGHFTAVYTGAINGDRVSGTVVWNGDAKHPGTWYATIPAAPCSPFSECPLTAGQILQLGQNSVNADLYSAGLQCFRIAADQGNADGQALVGMMLMKGLGTPPNPPEGLRLLTASGNEGSYIGAIGLSEVYGQGIGVVKNPQQAAFWKNKADAAQRQAQAQAEARAGVAIGAAVLGAMIIGALISDGSSPANNSRDPSDDVLRQQYRQLTDQCNGGEKYACDMLGRSTPNYNPDDQ